MPPTSRSPSRNEPAEDPLARALKMLCPETGGVLACRAGMIGREFDCPACAGRHVTPDPEEYRKRFGRLSCSCGLVAELPQPVVGAYYDCPACGARHLITRDGSHEEPPAADAPAGPGFIANVNAPPPEPPPPPPRRPRGPGRVHISSRPRPKPEVRMGLQLQPPTPKLPADSFQQRVLTGRSFFGEFIGRSFDVERQKRRKQPAGRPDGLVEELPPDVLELLKAGESERAAAEAVAGGGEGGEAAHRTGYLGSTHLTGLTGATGPEAEARAAEGEGEGGPGGLSPSQYLGEIEFALCDYCGASIRPDQGVVGEKGRRFCSRECEQRFMQLSRKRPGLRRARPAAPAARSPGPARPPGASRPPSAGRPPGPARPPSAGRPPGPARSPGPARPPKSRPKGL